MKQIFLDFSGTIEETKLIDGLILDQKTIDFGAPIRIEKAKIGLIQFCISPPKTDVKKILHLFFPQKILNNLDGKYSDYQ
jgi:hypothetical protein